MSVEKDFEFLNGKTVDYVTYEREGISINNTIFYFTDGTSFTFKAAKSVFGDFPIMTFYTDEDETNVC